MLCPPLPADRERGAINFTLAPAPRADEESADQPAIVAAAVLGLFPASNQGLLRDTRAMMGEEAVGPVRPFLTAGVDFDQPPKADVPAAPTGRPAEPAWLAAAADPCQARAVALAREGGALVVHGPPGTGKSQTITNVIADHLYRGERVLLVCDKRTALDVVADRLGHLGLRNLCGIVHDPRRDQRHLYAALKDQLDGLKDARTKPQAAGQLARTDAELRAVHDELLTHHNALMSSAGGEPSFSDLVGRWLALGADPVPRLDERATAGVTFEAVASHRAALLDLLDRARSVDWPRNPWAKCGGPPLADYLSRPMAAVRQAVSRCVATAQAADATIDPAMPPFADAPPLVEQGRARAAWWAGVASALPDVRAAGLAGWLGRDPAAVRRTAGRVRAVMAEMDAFDDQPPEDALRPAAPPAGDLGREGAAVFATLLSHYFGVGFIAAMFLWTAFAFRDELRKKTLVAIIAGGAVFTAAWGPFFWRQRRLFSTTDASTLFLQDDVPHHITATFQRLFSTPVRLLFEPHGSPHALNWFAIGGGFFVVLACVLVRRRPWIGLYAAWWTGAVVIPAAFDFTRGTAHLFHVRYVVLAAPAVCVLWPAMLGVLSNLRTSERGRPALDRHQSTRSTDVPPLPDGARHGRDARAMKHGRCSAESESTRFGWEWLVAPVLIACLAGLPDVYTTWQSDPAEIRQFIAPRWTAADLVVFAADADHLSNAGAQCMMIDRYLRPIPCRVLFLSQTPAGDAAAAVARARRIWFFTDNPTWVPFLPNAKLVHAERYPGRGVLFELTD